ncbi:MAG: 4Fe-4S binding protein [Lentisphaerae bacterium]|jgi:nitroreductase/NAD-dependent dihydropyrimidine dehydrogenase PreA subunit|nr:4Fe-4S binding protein [Lentisphaerota bacterium]
MNLIIDTEKCIGCGSCVKDCPANSLEMNNGIPGVARFGEKTCIKCLHCLAVCPEGALSIHGKTPEDCGTVRTLPQSDEVASLYQFRRSCRQYKHANVSEEKLRALQDVLRWTPTGHNDRGLHFSIVSNVETMDQIRSFVRTSLLEMLENNTLPAPFKWVKLRRAILQAGGDVVFSNAPHLIAVSAKDDSVCREIDPIIALAQFETMAQSLGLGTTWCGFGFRAFSLLEKDSRRILRIPDGYSLSYVMLFGEPDVHYPRSTAQDPPPVARISEFADIN